MTLSDKQKGVLVGMLTGLSGALALIGGGIFLNPFDYPAELGFSARLTIAWGATLIPGASLAFCIARLAKHRFLTPSDIDGSGLTSGSSRAMLLQALLQNTLEQAVLAIAVYLAWAALAPPAWISVVPLAALAFGLGRALFFWGYGGGAPGRALGVALTFYPSVLMGMVLIATWGFHLV
jgi:hypothetical protein